MRSDQVAQGPPGMQALQTPWTAYPKPRRFPWDLLLAIFFPSLGQSNFSLGCLEEARTYSTCGVASPASSYLQKYLPTSPSFLPPGLKSLPSLCFTLPGASSQRCLGIHVLKHDLNQQHLILQLSDSLSSLYVSTSTIRLGRG